jgi:hypothetical protein
MRASVAALNAAVHSSRRVGPPVEWARALVNDSRTVKVIAHESETGRSALERNARVSAEPGAEGSAAAGEAGLPRLDDGGSAVRHLQLCEDVGDMVPHRLQADHQLVGYRAVAFAGGEQF